MHYVKYVLKAPGLTVIIGVYFEGELLCCGDLQTLLGTNLNVHDLIKSVHVPGISYTYTMLVYIDYLAMWMIFANVVIR